MHMSVGALQMVPRECKSSGNYRVGTPENQREQPLLSGKPLLLCREREGNMLKNVEFGADCLSSNPGSLTSCFISQCIKFLICKTRMTIVPTSEKEKYRT